MMNNSKQEQLGLILALQYQKETDAILWDLLNIKKYHGFVDIWYEFNADRLDIKFEQIKKPDDNKLKNSQTMRWFINQEKQAVKPVV